MTRRDWRAVLAACMLLTAALAAVPAGAVHDTDREFTVDLHEDGTATVTFERRYNLSITSERDRFRTLANNSTALEKRRAAFGDQLRGAAANGSQRTAREMRIENVSVSTREVNGTGVVEYRARWVALGGVYGAQVVVNEPFSTSFDPNGTLVMRGPEGYERRDMNPPIDIGQLNTVFWGEEKDLDGFSARFVDPDAATATDAGENDGSTPPPEPSGFGRLVGAAGLALVPAMLVLLGAKRRDLLGGDRGGDGSGSRDGDG